MKTKDQLAETALKSEAGFKLAVVDLLADIRNSIITAILFNETEIEELINKAAKEMKRIISEESKEVKGVDLFLDEELKNEVKKKYAVTLCDPKDVPKDALWATHCSRRKSKLNRGIPKEIYTSPLNQEFYLWAEKKSIFYGTISDKYGLVMKNQVIKTYDLAPDKLSDTEKRDLGEAIGAQFRDLGYKSLVLYCKNYEEVALYLKILSYSGLKVYWIRSLPE